MEDENRIYTREQILSALENKDLSVFAFWERGILCASAPDYAVWILSEDGQISEEKRQLAVAVLKDLKTHIERAHAWLSHFNLKHDRWYPNALDNGFRLTDICIGEFETSVQFRPKFEGFTLTFMPVNCYACEFTVKFLKNMNPISVEESVE